MKLIIYLVLLTAFLTSCIDKRIKNPENTDLIYQDIQNDINKIKNVLKLRRTEIEIVQGEMDSLHIRSPEKVVKQKRIQVMESDIKRFEQLKKYFEVKLKKRKTYSRILYEVHYTDKKEWPDKNEFNKYILSKNLGQLPIEEINKADNSRELTHDRDISEILKKNGL